MKNRNITAKLAVLGAVIGTCFLASESAQAILFTGFDNTGPNGPRDASVDFEIVNGMLQVTLANTGPTPTTPPLYDATYSLLGVSFDFSGGTLTAHSASLNGSSLVPSTFVMPAGTTIGDYWGFDNNFHGNFIAGTGYGGNLGQGSFGSNPQNLQGSDGGLINWNSLAGSNPSVKAPQVDNSLAFTFTDPNLPTTLTASDFNAVTFWYGTSLSEESFSGTPNTNNTPVPDGGSTFELLGIAGLGLFAFVRKTKAA